MSDSKDAADDLVKRAQAGDRAAFTALFQKHKQDVARLVFRMMGPNPELEDVVQDVFVQVHRSLGEFRGQSRFTTWLHRVTVNVVLMVRRSAKSRPVFAGEVPIDVQAAAETHPDEETATRARVRAFYRILDKIADKKRAVFVLHDVEGHSPAEIAVMVDAPVLTVRTRLFYARKELNDLMSGDPSLAPIVRELQKKAEKTDAKAEGPRSSRSEMT